jgi:hypothetical protein
MPANGRWDLIRRLKVKQAMADSFYMVSNSLFRAILPLGPV